MYVPHCGGREGGWLGEVGRQVRWEFCTASLLFRFVQREVGLEWHQCLHACLAKREILQVQRSHEESRRDA